MLSKINVFQSTVVAKTSCKNVETLRRKNDLSCFKSLLVTGLWDTILTSLCSSLPFKVPPSFEHGLVLLATLIRGEGDIKSTRSWTGDLSQNTVQCHKYFFKQVVAKTAIKIFTSLCPKLLGCTVEFDKTLLLKLMKKPESGTASQRSLISLDLPCVIVHD